MAEDEEEEREVTQGWEGIIYQLQNSFRMFNIRPTKTVYIRPNKTHISKMLTHQVKLKVIIMPGLTRKGLWDVHPQPLQQQTEENMYYQWKWMSIIWNINPRGINHIPRLEQNNEATCYFGSKRFLWKQSSFRGKVTQVSKIMCLKEKGLCVQRA